MISQTCTIYMYNFQTKMARQILFYTILIICTSIACGFINDGNYIPNNRTDALEFLLVEEKQMRIKLEAKMEDLMNRLASVESEQDKCGCRNGIGSTAGHKPSFMATLSAEYHCGAKQPLIFDTVKLNSGTAYQPTHGVFKAPVNGTYAFFATLSIPPNSSFHVEMVKNAVTNHAGLYLHADHLGIWIERSSNVIIRLQKDDEVWMVCLYDSTIEGDITTTMNDTYDYHSHFSGFLVSED